MADANYTGDLALLMPKLKPCSILWSKQQEAFASLRPLIKELSKTRRLSSNSLKFVNLFIYFGSNILQIKSNVKIRIAKDWNSINRLLIIWKSDFCDEK